MSDNFELPNHSSVTVSRILIDGSIVFGRLYSLSGRNDL